MKKDFDKWIQLKKKIHYKKDKETVYSRKKEIWWCSLGANIGFEQDGKNTNFERPVLIVRKINRYLTVIVPLSTKIKSHPYYFTYNFNQKSYTALLLQVRVISSKRLLRRIGVLPQKEFIALSRSLVNFINDIKE